MLDAFAKRFQNGGELLPWQVSSKPFDFDQGFVDFLHQKYLPVALSKERREIERWQAVQWLNKAKFEQERLEAAFLQWSLYQESLTGTTAPVRSMPIEGYDPATPEAIAARERARAMLRNQRLE